jgi:twitching motility protein PilT
VNFASLLQFAVEHDASDVHIQVGSAPMMRIAGQVRAVEMPPVESDDLREFVATIAPAAKRNDLETAIVEGIDFSHAVPDLARFRCCAYRHLGKFGLTMRVIKSDVPPFDSLNLPKTIRDVALARRGLTLVTGTTGSGKSTTLAAMVELINEHHRAKIVTIEDPIEYVYTSKKALISQAEVGSDTPSFDHALRQALRQDPDVILIGELRDVQTLRMALRAADTGHQVFSTVHSATAAQTVERIIAMFPPVEHKLLLAQLAGSIEAIVSQRLVSLVEGGRRPAVEILRGNAVIEKFILENNVAEITDYLETGDLGMQTFDQHLLELYDEGLVRMTEALRWATNPEALARRMRGVKGS